MPLIDRQRFLLRLLINDRLREKFYAGSDCKLSTQDAKLLRRIPRKGVENKAKSLGIKPPKTKFVEGTSI